MLNRKCSALVLRPLMAECTAGAIASGINRQPAGGGLYLFFLRLMTYLRSPVSIIFVFDGPNRPRVKRGHQVQHAPPWWADAARQLIEIVGWQVHEVRLQLFGTDYIDLTSS